MPDNDRGGIVPADPLPGSRSPAFPRRCREEQAVRSESGMASRRGLRPGALDSVGLRRLACPRVGRATGRPGSKPDRRCSRPGC